MYKRQPQYQPTVGLLLCADSNQSTVRYALRSTQAPMAVATYTYDTLPPAERATLPSDTDVLSALEASVAVDGRPLTLTEYPTRTDTV